MINVNQIYLFLLLLGKTLKYAFTELQDASFPDASYRPSIVHRIVSFIRIHEISDRSEGIGRRNIKV